MQYSVVRYSDIQKGEGFLRLDSEHYKKTYLKIKNKLESKGYHYLHEILSKPIVTGHTPSMSNDTYYGGDIAFIKTDNVREHNIADNFSHYLTNEGNKKLKRSQLEAEDILLTIIGANFDVVGRASLVTHEILPANINQNIALIRLDKKKFNPKVLSAYLNSFYGRNYIYYLSRQTEQVNLNNKEVERLIIPNFSREISNLISDTVEKSYQLKLESKSLYSKAENLLLEELGLKDWKAQHQLSYIKNYSDTQKAERFDAEYFQPQYDELIEKVKNIQNDSLGNIIKWSKGIEVGSGQYIDEGFDFIRISDFSTKGISEASKKISHDLFAELKDKFSPKKGDILFTKDGTIGLTYLVNQDQEAIISGAFLKLRPKIDIESEYLALVLNSIICKKQIEMMSGGAIIAHLKPSDAMKLQIPILSSKEQKEISLKIVDSKEKDNQSKFLLSIAKKAVEMAIEKSEEQASNWIDEELEKLGVELKKE